MPLIHNILTCTGFASSAGGWFAGGDCFKGRIGLVVLFFIIALVRRWGAEEWGIEYNFFMSLILGIVGYLILITFTGSFPISFIAGLVIALASGYGVGGIWGGSGGDDSGGGSYEGE